MDYSDNVHNVYKNIEEYNPGKERKVLIVFDNMITDMINNKKLNVIITELFIRVENLIFLLSLLHNLILRCQKVLG